MGIPRNRALYSPVLDIVRKLTQDLRLCALVIIPLQYCYICENCDAWDSLSKAMPVMCGCIPIPLIVGAFREGGRESFGDRNIFWGVWGFEELGLFWVRTSLRTGQDAVSKTNSIVPWEEYPLDFGLDVDPLPAADGVLGKCDVREWEKNSMLCDCFSFVLGSSGNCWPGVVTMICLLHLR